MLPSKVRTTVNEDGEEGFVCWEGKGKKKVRGKEKAARMWQKWVGEDSRTCCRFPSTLVW
jgi:hypothetical protein